MRNGKSDKRQRNEDAIERNEAWVGLSYKDQLGILSRRPGNSKRQVARIKEKMNG